MFAGQAPPVRSSRPPTVSSNGVSIAFDETTFAPMRDSNHLAGDGDALRRRFREDGYVLLRNVLDRQKVLDVRADYFARFDPSLLAPGTPPKDGIFSGVEPPLPPYGTLGHPAYDLVRSPEFDRFTRDAALLAIVSELLDAPAELWPRRILRHFHRGAAMASRAHVDHDYMDRGSDRIVTAWIPLGDCPLESGGLIYLEGSHQADRTALNALRSYTDRPGDHRPISNDLGRTGEALGGRWLWTDYAAGDVVLHSPHLVHASLDVQSDAMRLSADLRYGRRGEAHDERWDRAWSADDGY